MMRLSCKNFAGKRRGVALVIVMVVVMLLALAAYGYNHQMATAYRLSRLQTERAQARLAALSGIESVLAVASLSPDQRTQRMQDLGFFQGRLEGAGAGEVTPGSPNDDSQWSFAVVSPRPTLGDEADADSGDTAGNLGGETAVPWRFGLRNESTKLNVDMLRRQESLFRGHARSTLMRLAGATPEDVDAFLRVHGIVSAQSEPRDLMSQLTAKTAASDVRDAQRRLARLWTGGDWDHNYRIETLERLAASGGAQGRGGVDTAAELGPSGGGSDSLATPWRDQITFQSGRRNVNRFGLRRIWLNANNLQQLHRELSKIWPSQWADYLVLARQYGWAGAPRTLAADASSPLSPVAETGIGIADTAIDWTVPARFSLVTPLDLVGTSIRIAGPENAGPENAVRLVYSPWQDTILDRGDYLESLVDEVTTESAAFLVGQIDVTASPSVVMMGVPGMTPVIASRIVDARRGAVSADANRDTVAWLVLQDVIDIQTLQQWFPWITVGGDCYSGQAIGFRDPLSPVFRCTFVIDGRPGIRGRTSVGLNTATDLGLGPAFDLAVEPAFDLATEPATEPAPAPAASVRIERFQHWHGWGRGFDLSRLRPAN